MGTPPQVGGADGRPAASLWDHPLAHAEAAAHAAECAAAAFSSSSSSPSPLTTRMLSAKLITRLKDASQGSQRMLATARQKMERAFR
jgi:hypothetical protein